MSVQLRLAENLINVFHRSDGVKLVEIHMVGVETLQGTLQLLASTLGVAAHSLFREENPHTTAEETLAGAVCER